MADNDEQANLIVSAVNEATQTLNEVQKSFESFEGAAQSLGVTSVALGNILSDVVQKAFEELKNMVRLGINEAIEAEQIQMQLANSFKAEGDSAAGAVKKINDAANALGGLIGVDNDVIASSATVIRQLTGLSEEIIIQLMPAIGDLAVKTGSYESASQMVARAINGQGRAFRQLGIDLALTDDEATNAVVIMGELNERFGGSAAANMETTGGKIQALKVTFTDVAQAVGEVITKSGLFNDVLTAIKNSLSLIQSTATDDTEAEKNKKNLEDLKKLGQDYTNTVQGTTQAIVINEKALAQLTETAKKEAEKRKKDEEDARERAEVAGMLQVANYNAVADAQAARERRAADETKRLIEEKNLFDKEQTELLQNTKENIAEQAVVRERDRLNSIFAEMEATMNFVAQIAGSITNAIASSFSNLVLGFFDKTKSMSMLMKDFFISIGSSILQMLSQIIAKLIIYNILASAFSLGSGGIGGALALFANKGLNSMGLGEFQTPEGGSRLIPGPPNIPSLAIVHGGETVGRGGESGGGGITLQIQGDYFESEDANGRLFDRLYRYQQRNGLAFG